MSATSRGGALLDLEQGRRLARPATDGEPTADRRRRRGGALAWLAVVVAVVVAAWWYALAQALTPTPGAMEIVSRTLDELARYAGAGVDGATAYASPERWALMGQRVRETVVMSVLASGLAGAAALATVAFASRVLTVGEFGRGWGPVRRGVFGLTRGAHVVARAVPEVIWALVFVFLLGPGLLTGALALAVHEAGVLGRLGSDVVDDVDRAPLRALRSAGAGAAQVFAYGVLPQVLPQLVTFLLYRWEVVVRATVVIGFVAAAGLGHQLLSDLAQRSWTGVGQVLLMSVLLAFAAEAVAAGLRRLAR